MHELTTQKLSYKKDECHDRWRIQDFPDEGLQPPGGSLVSLLFVKIFAENFMKMKEIQQNGGSMILIPLLVA